MRSKLEDADVRTDEQDDCLDDDDVEKADGDALVNSRENIGNNTTLDSGATKHCAKHVPGALETATVGSMSGLNGTRIVVARRHGQSKNGQKCHVYARHIKEPIVSRETA